MKKKNFILIGISILLQILGITLPFIGIGENGIQVIEFFASNAVSLLLLYFGLKGLYNDTRNHDFYVGSIMCIVGICVMMVGTFFSPLIAGGNFVGSFNYLKNVFEHIGDEDALFIETSRFFASYGVLLAVNAVVSYFYAVGLFRFVNGIKSQNVVLSHKVKLNKSVKTFSIVNVILFVLAALIMFIFTKMFKIILFNAYIDIATPDGAILILIVLALYLVLLPAAIVSSVFYYVNIVKSIIFVFKTPSNIIPEKVETEVVEEVNLD